MNNSSLRTKVAILISISFIIVASIILLPIIGDWINPPPGRVEDLEISSVSDTSVTLTWIASGSDGYSGQASRYDVRYTENETVTETSWDTALQAEGEPVPSRANIKESFTIYGMSPATRYFFALKVVDEVQKWSPMSNVVEAITKVFGVRFQTDLTPAKPVAQLNGFLPWGPLSVESNITGDGLVHCTLKVNQEEAHTGECSRFRYVYRFQQALKAVVTFELELSLGTNGTQTTITVSIRSMVNLNFDTIVNMEFKEWDSPLQTESYSSISSGVGTGVEVLNWNTSLQPGEQTRQNVTARGWVWVNITVSATVTYTIWINELVVVEGDCHGSITIRYRWIDEETEFELEIEIEAYEMTQVEATVIAPISS